MKITIQMPTVPGCDHVLVTNVDTKDVLVTTRTEIKQGLTLAEPALLAAIKAVMLNAPTTSVNTDAKVATFLAGRTF